MKLQLINGSERFTLCTRLGPVLLVGNVSTRLSCFPLLAILSTMLLSNAIKLCSTFLYCGNSVRPLYCILTFGINANDPCLKYILYWFIQVFFCTSYPHHIVILTPLQQLKNTHSSGAILSQLFCVTFNYKFRLVWTYYLSGRINAYKVLVPYTH